MPTQNQNPSAAQTQNMPPENKMGTMPIPKLLISMALPMIISMLVQALYNVVDSIFVAKISENALTAVSLAFPIQNLMIALSSGTAVGVNALLSKSLGEKDFKQVNAAAINGIFLAFLSFVAFLIFGLVGSHMFFSTQTGIAEIIESGTDYLTICSVFSFGIFGQMMFERLLQSTGKTFYTMITQGTGAIINIILDPILIFGLLGFPALGVAGAAIATVFGQIVAMILAIIFNLKHNHEISFAFKKFRPSGHIIKRIYIVGIPSIIMMSIGSVMTYGMNQILMVFSSTAAAVLGVYFKLQSFVFMPVFGLNNGMIPIVSYNYGACHKDRIMKTIRLSICLAISIMILGLIVVQCIPGPLLMMFNASEDMLAIGIPALRTITLSFIFAGFCIIVGTVFQALGNGVLSMIVSIARQLVVLLPVAYLLSRVGGLNAVWWAFPIAELVSVILSTIFMKHIYDKIIKPLSPKPAAEQAIGLVPASESSDVSL